VQFNRHHIRHALDCKGFYARQSRLRCLQLFDGNEVVVGQKIAFPSFFFRISHKCAAKVEKTIGSWGG